MQQMDRDREKNGDSKSRANSLLDKQLQDILRSAERTHRRQLFWQRLRGRTRSLVGRRGRAARTVSAGQLMVIGLGLCLVAGMLGRALPGLGAPLLLVGAIVFISPIFLGLGRRGRGYGRDERLWRGRVVEYPRDDPFANGRRLIQNWLRRRGGGPPRPRR